MMKKRDALWRMADRDAGIRRRMRRSRRSGKLGGRLLVVLALVAGGAWFGPRAGDLLVVEDPFERAEVAVVLSGQAVARSLAAAELFKQGRVQRIVVIPEPPDPTLPELVRLGLADPDAAPISARILAASGVPRDRIAFLPQPADGTITEAVRIRSHFEHDPPEALVIVTSKSATRRARFIFRRVFEGVPVRILAHPSRVDAFQTRRWWAQPRNALTVVMEYQKFLSNALTLALRHP
jgi:uncharacterized SAM-binding protein YcdF (DUF218 family)